MKFEKRFNLVENFLAQHDRDGATGTFAFNYKSHLVFHVDRRFSHFELLNAVRKLVEAVPVLSLKAQFRGSEVLLRRGESSESVELSKRVIEIAETDTESEDAFLDGPIPLHSAFPFRILLQNSDQGSKITMTIHHAYFDGISQLDLAVQLMRLLDDEEVEPWVRKMPVFYFREHFLRSGWLWILRQGIGGLREIVQREATPDPATLVPKGAQIQEYRVRRKDVVIRGAEYDRLREAATLSGQTLFEFYVENIVQAFATLEPVSHGGKPVIFSVPVNLRPLLKIRRYLGNVVGRYRVQIPFEQLRSPDFRKLLRSQTEAGLKISNSTEKLFAVQWMRMLMPPKRYRAMIQRQQVDPERMRSSFFISAVTPPRRLFQFLRTFKVIRIYGHGAVAKSPGIGVILCDFRANSELTIVFEYVDGLIPERQVEAWASSVRTRLERISALEGAR